MFPYVSFFVVCGDFKNAKSATTTIRLDCEWQSGVESAAAIAGNREASPVHEHCAAVVFVACYSSYGVAAFHDMIKRHDSGLLLRECVDGVQLAAG